VPYKAKVLIAGNFLSALGNGLVFPFMFVYLHEVRGITSALSGVVAGYGMLASLIFSPLHGWLIDHWGPRPVLFGSLIASAIGYAGMAKVNSFATAIIVFTIISFGQSAMWPSQSALAVEIVPGEYVTRYFGAQFALMNLGLGLGGLVSSIFVLNERAASYERLYFVDGISFLIYFGFVIFIKDVGHRNIAERKERSELGEGWREVFKDKKFIAYWLVAVLCIFSGYSQLEVGFTAFSRKFAHVSPGVLAWAFAANTFLIATTQLWFTKRVERVEARKALALAVAFWILAWVALAASGVFTGYAIALVIGCQAIFGIGEMIWSPVMPTVINSLAPDHLRGRYNAFGANAWQIAGIGGPILAGSLIGANLQWLWITGLVITLAIAGLFALRLNISPAK
jgi:MFS family permease